MIEIQASPIEDGCKTDERTLSKSYKTVAKSESYREALLKLAELSNAGTLSDKWIRIKEGNTITIINPKPNTTHYGNQKTDSKVTN